MPSPFVKGHPKWGGRKKGVPNKAQIELAEYLQDINCDPIDGMVDLLKLKISNELRFRIYQELAQYCYAKRKAIQVDLGEGTIQIIKRVIGVNEADV